MVTNHTDLEAGVGIAPDTLFLFSASQPVPVIDCIWLQTQGQRRHLQNPYWLDVQGTEQGDRKQLEGQGKCPAQ
jgi:hypothetical protein